MTEKPEVFRKYDIRGQVPEEIDSDIVFRVGKALGRYWGEGKVVVGRDHRNSSKLFQNAMTAGLSSQGMEVTVIGLATTDLTALATRKDFDAGVMLTASHMPSSFGGIKPLDSSGRILDNDEMKEVKELYGDLEDREYGEIRWGGYRQEYLDSALERYNEVVDHKPGKAVIDPGNGVGGFLLPELLERLGGEVELINEDLDPDFPDRSPEPGKDNLEDLKQKVVETDADIGIALDGDADRAMFVDERGEVLPGDESLAILSRHYLDNTDEVVISLNTSTMIEEVVEHEGGKTRKVPVGAVFTALECQDSEAGLGGQPNGHLMDPEFVPYDSGTFLGAVMAGIAARKPLSEIREGLPDYRQEKWDIKTDEKQRLMENIRKNAREKEMIENDRYDTLKIDTGYGSAVIRPSGSEDVIRVRSESKEDFEEHERVLKNIIEQKEKK